MAQYPQVRGNRVSWSSIDLLLNGSTVPVIGVKNINYGGKLTPGMVMGTHPLPIARTQGVGELSGSIEPYLQEFTEFQDSIAIITNGHGFMEVSFNVVVNYSEDGIRTVTDTLVGCRISEVPAANAQGSDATSRNLVLSVMDVLFNGKSMVKNRLGFRRVPSAPT